MPYIASEERERAKDAPRTPGELNYAITLCFIKAYRGTVMLPQISLRMGVFRGDVARLIRYYWSEKVQNYTTINDIYGAIACSLLEFRRRADGQNFGPMELLRRSIARALSRVVDDFYAEVVVPYENTKIRENGDVYPT
jgi:hypothetical protein